MATNYKNAIDCIEINSPSPETYPQEEDDDSTDILDIPVNVEIITDEDDDGEIEYESEDSPPMKRRKTPDSDSYPMGTAALLKIENIKESLNGKSARECFEQFFTDEVFETMVKGTERYATTVKNKRDFTLSVTDVKILLGFMIFAGYHRLPCERDYWSDDEDLGIPLVKAAMTRNAFAEIKAYLHLQDNSKVRESEKDETHKIRPLMDVLNKNFQKWGVFHESLSMGEIIVSCVGANRTKQKKPSRVSYKLGLLCGEGYCYRFWFSNGQESESQLGPRVLKDSVNPGNAKPPMSFLDPLRLQPQKKAADMFQKQILSKKFVGDAEPHINLIDPFRLQSHPDTTQHQILTRKFVGGTKYYELLLKKHSIPIRGKKWYWCLITRMIDMAIVNAYHVFRETQDSHKCLKDFRREIAVPYLKLGHCRRISRSLAPNPSRTHVNEDVRFDGLNHIIGKREKQRRCQFPNCKGRPKTYCVKCNITLCTTCFPQFHFR